MRGREKMHESAEDYIETIYLLSQKNGSVRSVDVATELGFSRPSVSRAVSNLKKSGMIEMSADGELVLTDMGIAKAREVYDKHTTLTRFLVTTAGVSDQAAEIDACRIEHIISDETFAGIKKFLREYSA